MAKDDDGGRILPQKDGSYKQLKVFERLTVTETNL